MILALAATLALASAKSPPVQIMAGRDLDRLLKGVSNTCPARADAVRYTFPAKLVDVEDSLIKALSAKKRAAVSQSIAHANCGDGAGCPAGAGLAAIRHVGATRRLVQAVCAEPEDYWR
jgi:hypothetical protein